MLYKNHTGTVSACWWSFGAIVSFQIRLCVTFVVVSWRSNAHSLSWAACGCWLHQWLRTQLCRWCSALHYQCSFCRPRKDDRLSQPHLVLIQQPTGLKLRTLRSHASHPNRKGSARIDGQIIHSKIMDHGSTPTNAANLLLKCTWRKFSLSK